MTYQIHFTEQMAKNIEQLPYEDAIKIIAALSLIDKYGVSPAILEIWGRKNNGKHVLIIPTSKTVEKSEKDEFITYKNYQSIEIELSEF